MNIQSFFRRDGTDETVVATTDHSIAVVLILMMALVMTPILAVHVAFTLFAPASVSAPAKPEAPAQAQSSRRDPV